MYNEDLKRFYENNPNVNEPNDFVRLDGTGKIPASNLPGYVDDIIEGYYYDSKFYEDDAHTKVIKGEDGKLYLDLPTNNTYRWAKQSSQYILISSTPPDLSMFTKFIEVTNITAMTTAQINSLRCGDMVIKNESGNKHTYIVTYKEDEQGICLSYMDATIIETVSYDYTDGEWVYNSTDVGHLS